MKLCTRCNTQLNDNEQFCIRCGGNQFRRPMPQPNRTNMQGRNLGNQGNPNNMASMNSGQQLYNQRQQYNTGQNQVNNMAQDNQFIDYANQNNKAKSWAERRAEKKAQDEAIMQQIRTGKPAQLNTSNAMNTNYYDSQFNDCNNIDMTIKDWIIQILLTAIPLVNIVILIMGMNNTAYPEYRRNFCKAFLIYYISATILSVGITLIINFI